MCGFGFQIRLIKSAHLGRDVLEFRLLLCYEKLPNELKRSLSIGSRLEAEAPLLESNFEFLLIEVFFYLNLLLGFST